MYFTFTLSIIEEFLVILFMDFTLVKRSLAFCYTACCILSIDECATPSSSPRKFGWACFVPALKAVISSNTTDSCRIKKKKKSRYLLFTTHSTKGFSGRAWGLTRNPHKMWFAKFSAEIESDWDLEGLRGQFQFSSVTQYCPILCDPKNRSTPCIPVHHQLPELTQTHVHWVGDAIQPSHPLSSPSPPVFNLSQHQGLFKRVSSSHQVAKILEFQLQHQSFKWTPWTDFL